jgi:transposase
MARRMLTDELWSKLREMLSQHRIYDKPFLRDMVERMLFRMRVSCPWRDLPKEFGFWNTIFQKFNRWSLQNKLMMVFKMLVHEPELEWEFIDGSIVKAHQHSAGAASDWQICGWKYNKNTYGWAADVKYCSKDGKDKQIL